MLEVDEAMEGEEMEDWGAARGPPLASDVQGATLVDDAMEDWGNARGIDEPMHDKSESPIPSDDDWASLRESGRSKGEAVLNASALNRARARDEEHEEEVDDEVPDERPTMKRPAASMKRPAAVETRTSMLEQVWDCMFKKGAKLKTISATEEHLGLSRRQVSEHVYALSHAAYEHCKKNLNYLVCSAIGFSNRAGAITDGGLPNERRH